MSNTETEIAALEERLRLAELGPDPSVFEELLADDAVFVDQSGTAALAKTKDGRWQIIAGSISG